MNNCILSIETCCYFLLQLNLLISIVTIVGWHRKIAWELLCKLLNFCGSVGFACLLATSEKNHSLSEFFLFPDNGKNNSTFDVCLFIDVMVLFHSAVFLRNDS